MFQSIGKLSLTTLAYGIANAISAGAPLLLIPVYTRFMNPEEFGTVSIFNTIVILLSSVIGFGTSAAVQKKFFDLEQNQLRTYSSTAIQMIAAISLAFVFLVGILSLTKDTLFGIQMPWLYLAVLAATSAAIQQILLAIWQSQQNVKAYVKFQITYSAALLGTPTLLMIAAKLGMIGALTGTAIAYIFFGVVAAIVLDKMGHIRQKASQNYLLHIVRFGYPLFPQLTAGWAIAMLDRFFIQKSWGLAAVGAYSLAFQLAQPLNVFSASVTQALTPSIYSALARKDSAARHSNKTQILLAMILTLALALLITLAAPPLIRAVAPAYEHSIPFIPWLTAALMFNGFYRLATIQMLFHEKTRQIAQVIFGVALVSTAANFLIIPVFGPIAAGWVSCASFFTIFLLTSQNARNINKAVEHNAN